MALDKARPEPGVGAFVPIWMTAGSIRAWASLHDPNTMSPTLPLVLIGALALAGCASAARPVLYPNDHLRVVGQAQADADLAECRRLAETAGASGGAGQAERSARGAGVGGAIGGATGAVGGAILGRPGTGAALGAATGATAGLMRSLFGRSAPSSAYRGFVDRCLQERGYDPVGWE